jgi:hypothetical protein
MKRIDKSLGMAFDLFPKYHQPMSGQYRPYHFAFLYKKNKLVSIGVNSYDPSPKILYLANRFNVQKYKQYNYAHAETDAISKAWGKFYLDSSFSFVIIRLNRFGMLQNSKPCANCQSIIDSIGINDVWWSTKNCITNGKEDYVPVSS